MQNTPLLRFSLRSALVALFLVQLAVFNGSAYAQTPSGTANSTADGDWMTSSTWGAIKAADSVAANIYHDVTVTTDVAGSRVPYTSGLVIGDASNANGDGSLAITTDGRLAFSGTTTIARNVAGTNGGNGTLMINGGSFAAAAINVGSGSTSVNTALGQLTLTNRGTLTTTGTVTVGGNSATQQRGAVTVTGSANNITFSGFNLRNGTLTYTADAQGISTITVTGNTILSDANARLVVDGTAYTGGSAVWKLIDGTNTAGLTNFSFDTLPARTTITGFAAANYLTELVYDGTSYDLSLQITDISPPVIITPPQSQDITVGGTVNLAVVASGASPLTYQWAKDGAAISGATADTLTITNAQVTAAGSYTVTVGNDYGTATSAAASLTVTALATAPSITTQPVSRTIDEGQNVTFTVAVSGTSPFTYQWKKGGVDVSDGGRIAGATTDALALTTVQLADAGEYTVVVSNQAGSVTSQAARLTVNTTAPPTAFVPFVGTYTQNFDGLPKTAGDYSSTSDGPFSLTDTTSWSVTAFSTTGLEGWQIYETGGSSGAALFVGDGSGTTSGACSYGAAGSTERALGSLGGSGRIMAFGVVLRNDTGTTITNVVVSYTGEQWRLGRSEATPPEDTLSFGYKTGVETDIKGTFTGNSALNFVTPTTTGATGALDGNATANRTSLTATLSSLTWAPGEYLVLRWSDTNETGNDHGLAVDDLSISAPGISLSPTIVTPPQGQTAIEGDVVNFEVVATGAPTLRYQWNKGGAMIDGATQSTLSLTSVQVTDAGEYTVTVTNEHGTITSAAAILTVEALTAPTITTQPSGQTILEGQNATFTVVAVGTAPLTYQWKKGGADVIDGERIVGATTDTLTITGAQLDDAGDYSVVVTNRAGSAPSLTATLTVGAAPVPTAPVANAASNIKRTSFTVSWSALPYATGYRLDVALDPAFSSFVTGYEDLDVGANLSATVTVLTSGTTYYYRVRAYNSSGTSGNSATVLVTTEAGQAPTITSDNKTTFTVGVPSSFTVKATGSEPIAFAATGLPAWASLNAATGVLSGTAPVGTASTTVVLTITASNDTPSKATQTFTLNLDAIPAIANPLIVSTLAGTAATKGTTNGTGANARFSEPLGAVADSAGVIYVADSANHTIRKVTAAGAVTTFAGKAGTAGSADGTGTAATFNAPSDLAIDGTGNLYVADTLNHTIRKITSAGAVTTLAGQAGSAGSADGTGAAARFAGPQGVAVSGDTLYVADTGNHTIRKIDLSTVAVTAVAGQAGVAGSTDATGTAATFNFPSDLVVGAEGRIYVADTENNVIRAIAADGAVTTLAGLAGSTGAADGSGSAARFNQPSAIVADGTGATLYVIDTDNHTVRQVVGAMGTVTTLAGLAGTAGSDDGMGAAARFNLPSGIAWTSNSLLIADTANHTLRKGLFPAAIVIAAQPQDRTVTTGNTAAAFTVTATGQPAPTYQWYFNGAAIAGATSSSYAVANAQSANAGTYWVVVSNALGSVKSDEVTLTVRDPGEPHGAAAGGGGAPGVWFLLALSLLAAARRMVVRR